jgi:hypothetical protein
MSKEQDLIIDDMITSVRRLGAMGETLEIELDTQHKSVSLSRLCSD